MLKAYSYSDALGLDVNARGIEVAVYVACRMSCSQDDGAAEGTSCIGLYTYNLILLHDEAVHACLEVYFTATAAYGLAHVLNDARQLIGTDVWVCIAQYGGRCSVLAEYIEYLLFATAFLAARLELAVRVGSCATFTKTVVTLGVYGMFA